MSSTINPPAPRNLVRKPFKVPAHRLEKTVGKRLRRELDDLHSRMKLPDAVVDSFQQMGFPEADSAVDQKRVEGNAGRVCHLHRGSVRQSVARPCYKVFKPAQGPALRCG